MVVSEVTSVLWESSVPKLGIFESPYLLFVFTVMCVVTSVAQNLEVLKKIEKLELSTFGKNPCRNCMVEQRVKYLEIDLKKILAINLVGQSVNWSNNFTFGLAGTITSFGFNLAVTVLRICYTNRINKKFKIWEEWEELKFLRKLERMQFPPAADYEMTILLERW